MSFIFSTANNEIDSGALDVLNGNFDLYLLTTTPDINNTVVSDLSAVSGMSPIPLVNNFTSTIWSFQTVTTPVYTYTTAPIGYVITKRTGATAANTDRVIYFSPLLNSLGQLIYYSTGNYRIVINFDVEGIINFTTTNEYFSGAYVNTETIPKGVSYLLGSNNNTTIFTNPSPSKITGRYQNTSTTGTIGNEFFDRISTNATSSYKRVVFSFPGRRIRLGTFAWLSNIASADMCYIYGNNDMGALTDPNISTANWTLLSSNSSITGSNTWNFLNTINNNYWTYLKWECISDSFNAHEIEFYNSSIISSSLNLV
jgi:hypothetical protein